MSEMSDALENALLNEVLRNTGYTPVATVYAALFKSPVTDANLEANVITNECAGTGYTRIAATFNAASGGVCTNQLITFPVVGHATDWGTITHMAIMDASSGAGTLGVLVYTTLTAPVTPGLNDQLKFAASDLTVTFA